MGYKYKIKKENLMNYLSNISDDTNHIYIQQDEYGTYITIEFNEDCTKDLTDIIQIITNSTEDG